MPLLSSFISTEISHLQFSWLSQPISNMTSGSERGLVKKDDFLHWWIWRYYIVPVSKNIFGIKISSCFILLGSKIGHDISFWLHFCSSDHSNFALKRTGNNTSSFLIFFNRTWKGTFLWPTLFIAFDVVISIACDNCVNGKNRNYMLENKCTIINWPTLFFYALPYL